MQPKQHPLFSALWGEFDKDLLGEWTKSGYADEFAKERLLPHLIDTRIENYPYRTEGTDVDYEKLVAAILETVDANGENSLEILDELIAQHSDICDVIAAGRPEPGNEARLVYRSDSEAKARDMVESMTPEERSEELVRLIGNLSQDYK